MRDWGLFNKGTIYIHSNTSCRTRTYRKNFIGLLTNVHTTLLPPENKEKSDSEEVDSKEEGNSERWTRGILFTILQLCDKTRKCNWFWRPLNERWWWVLHGKVPYKKKPQAHGSSQHQDSVWWWNINNQCMGIIDTQQDIVCVPFRVMRSLIKWEPSVHSTIAVLREHGHSKTLFSRSFLQLWECSFLFCIWWTPFPLEFIRACKIWSMYNSWIWSAELLYECHAPSQNCIQTWDCKKSNHAFKFLCQHFYKSYGIHV